MSKFTHGQFCAWDGEGAAIRGVHEYVALVNSDGAGGASTAARTDAQGLRTLDTLTWLAEQLQARAAMIHVGFAFSYDSNMLLRDVPRPILQRLWADGLCYWKQFRIEYKNRKSLGVWERRYITGVGWVWRGGRIWDVFGFFQSSFVAALQSYDVGTPAERASIQAMKLKRAHFKPRDLPKLITYAQHECRLLVQLMEKVRQSAQAAGLTFRRWDGAGVAAAAWLLREGVKEHLGPDPAQPSPRWPEAVRDAGQYAYFGGRIECGQVGHTTGPVWQYDIRSAYPDALRRLPTFAPGTGTWVHNPPQPWRVSFAVHRVRWALAPGARVYPFPWRSWYGSVFFPPAGEGWYWTPEVRGAFAARRQRAITGEIAVLETWGWIPAGDYPHPFRGLEQLYAQRRRWKSEGNGAEKMAKLAINSCYGKLAQQLGGSPGQAPSYHNLEAAGWVTSWCRARLFHAAVEAGPHWIMLATDAIYTTRPQRRLQREAGEELGAWDAVPHRSATVVQSGVYWVGRGTDTLMHYRGFDPDSLDRAAIIQAWRDGATTWSARSTRFQTLGACVGSDTAFQKWRSWRVTQRQLDLQPRSSQKRVVRGSPRALGRGLVWTTPVQPARGAHQGILSAPVRVPWRTLAGDVSSADMNVLARVEDEGEDAGM